VLCETDIQQSWRAAPQSFAALMALYESNYLRLRALAGDLRLLPALSVSLVAGDCQLRLGVTERSPHTTVGWLTYLLPPGQSSDQTPAPMRVPDLRLKLYHDARMLEVLRAEGRAERELRRCWQQNQMLNKWLEYCAERGHRLV
jgi:uncharacterized protein